MGTVVIARPIFTWDRGTERSSNLPEVGWWGTWNFNLGVLESGFTFLLTLLCWLSKSNLNWPLKSQDKYSFTHSLNFEGHCTLRSHYIMIDTVLHALFIQSILIKCDLCAGQSPRYWEYRGEKNIPYPYSNYNRAGIHKRGQRLYNIGWHLMTFVSLNIYLIFRSRYWDFPVVQWLRLHAPKTGGLEFHPWLGN